MAMHEETVVIREQVGSGGSATVYRGSLSPSNADVAVKIVKKDLHTEKGRKIYNRTKSESRIMSEINHKHVCKIMGEVETDTNVFLVLQYASNGDLLDRLNAQGPLSEKQTRRIFKQLVLAINYLHGRGVVHRDLKPGTSLHLHLVVFSLFLLFFLVAALLSSGFRWFCCLRRDPLLATTENVFFDANDNVLLGDFGFAMTWSPVQTVEEYVGTLNYAAPEIVTHTPYTGPELDMWSLGALLLAMLTARIPFDAPTEEATALKITEAKYKMPVGVSSAAKDLLAKLLEPNPLKRATMMDVLGHPWMQTRFQRTTTHLGLAKKLRQEAACVHSSEAM
jgi:serine/threonine protein kinase